jgi:hypothetical protein
LENQLRGLLGVSMGFSDFLMAEVEPSHGRVLEESNKASQKSSWKGLLIGALSLSNRDTLVKT